MYTVSAFDFQPFHACLTYLIGFAISQLSRFHLAVLKESFLGESDFNNSYRDEGVGKMIR